MLQLFFCQVTDRDEIKSEEPFLGKILKETKLLKFGMLAVR